MAKVLIIGAGGVGTVVAHKCAQNPDVFNEIVMSRMKKQMMVVTAEKTSLFHDFPLANLEFCSREA